MATILARYREIFGGDFAYPEKKMVWQLRANTIKIPSTNLKEKLERYGKVKSAEFYEDAFLLESKENMSKSLEHVLGYFFLQNISSMIPPLVLNPKVDDIILDLAASPGAKTTQIAALMKNTGAIIANDVNEDRLKALRGNLQRCGVANTIVTRSDGKSLKTGMKFDKILLDAPCTGTGTLSPRILKSTSENSIKRLSSLQKQLLISANNFLNNGGTLVYSTCSLEPEENEENVNFAVEKLGLSIEKIELDGVPFEKAMTEWYGKTYDDSVANAMRIVLDGVFEGFFICKLRKH